MNINDALVQTFCEYIDYNKDTGVFYWKKIQNNGTAAICNVAGKCTKDGGKRVMVKRHEYKLDKMAWILVYGHLCQDAQIMHLDSDINNNAIDNLKLRSLLTYCDLFRYETGVLYWKIDVSRTGKMGKVAGKVNIKGYCEIFINGKAKQRHRIIWEMFNGTIPDGYQVDHINDISGDDRLENLQLLTATANSGKKRNSHIIPTNNTSGVKGVTFRKQRGNKTAHWEVRIGVANKRKYVGSACSCSLE